MERVSELLSLLFRYLARRLHIAFVSDQDFANARLRVLLDFLDPGAHIFKGFAICYVVHYYDSLSAAVVAGGECAEALLASGVPNLKLDDLSLMLDRFQLLHSEETLIS